MSNTKGIIKIGDDSFKQNQWRGLISYMQSNLPRLGVVPSDRLYRVAAIALGYPHPPRKPLTELEARAADELKKGQTFADLEEFADFLYARKLVAARMGGFVPHRARNLGARPPWIKPVNEARLAGRGLAIRHIVPSHLLGYAAENATGDLAGDFKDLVDAYKEAYIRWKPSPAEEVDVVPLFSHVKPTMRLHTSHQFVARRWAWALLYNHPGNLWVGDAESNQVIGFMYATVSGVLHRMKHIIAAEAPEGMAAAVDEALTALQPFRTEPSNASAERIDDPRVEISRILAGIEKDDVELSSITDVISYIEDIAANLQLDIPRLGDWGLVQEWRERFIQPGVSIDELCDFLRCDFNGSLSKWVPSAGVGTPRRRRSKSIASKPRNDDASG